MHDTSGYLNIVFQGLGYRGLVVVVVDSYCNYMIIRCILVSRMMNRDERETREREKRERKAARE